MQQGLFTEQRFPQGGQCGARLQQRGRGPGLAVVHIQSGVNGRAMNAREQIGMDRVEGWGSQTKIIDGTSIDLCGGGPSGGNTCGAGRGPKPNVQNTWFGTTEGGVVVGWGGLELWCLHQLEDGNMGQGNEKKGTGE